MADNGSAADRQDPAYHVVRVAEDGNTLTIIARDWRAKTPEKATDQVVERLAVEERNGTFGAFTARSFWFDEYEVEQVIQTKKKGRTAAKPAKAKAAKANSKAPAA